MAKKTSLTDALNSAGKTVQEESPATPTDGTVSRSRVGKKLIAGHFDPAVHRQLKQLSLDEDRSIQALLAEALDDLFAKHGSPSGG